MQHLGPRQLGQALGVSESSVKRWADQGEIVTHRTSGGHRRIALAEAIRFIRESGLPVVDPGILGAAGMPDEQEGACRDAREAGVRPPGRAPQAAGLPPRDRRQGAAARPWPRVARRAGRWTDGRTRGIRRGAAGVHVTGKRRGRSGPVDAGCAVHGCARRTGGGT